MFGSNPSLPAVYNAAPSRSSLEEVEMKKAVEEQINAMHMVIEAFMECDRVIKTTLKRKLSSTAQEVY